METDEDEEEEEIEEEDLFDEPRLMTHMDEFVEKTPPPRPKKKRSSRQTSTTTGPQPPKARKNDSEPRRFYTEKTSCRSSVETWSKGYIHNVSWW
jgi:hypothetical protein